MSERDYRDELTRIADAISDTILEMTDDEIIQECIDEGEDPEEVAAQVRTLLLQTVEKHKRAR